MRRAIILDTETTGLDASKAYALEIALKVVNTETGKCLGSFQSVVALSKKEWGGADPAALKINGFTWDGIQTHGRLRSDIAVDICSLFSQLKLSPQNAFFLCQNPSFDRAFFSQLCPLSVQKSCGFPYYWLDFASMNWALTAKDIVLGKRSPFCIPFSKDGIARHEGLPLEEKPHKAMNGVDHLLLLFTKIVGFPLSSPPTLRRSARNLLDQHYRAPIKPIRLQWKIDFPRSGNKTKRADLVKNAPRRSARNRTSTQFFEP